MIHSMNYEGTDRRDSRSFTRTDACLESSSRIMADRIRWSLSGLPVHLPLDSLLPLSLFNDQSDLNNKCTSRKSKPILLDMHFLWSKGLRPSVTSRLLTLTRLRSTKATAQDANSLFTYGKDGHYFHDHIDPNESVRCLCSDMDSRFILLVSI